MLIAYIDMSWYKHFNKSGGVKLDLWTKASAHKSLKLPKGKSESVNRRRTDKTMIKSKSTKTYRMSNTSPHSIFI